MSSPGGRSASAVGRRCRRGGGAAVTGTLADRAGQGGKHEDLAERAADSRRVLQG